MFKQTKYYAILALGLSISFFITSCGPKIVHPTISSTGQDQNQQSKTEGTDKPIDKLKITLPSGKSFYFDGKITKENKANLKEYFKSLPPIKVTKEEQESFENGKLAYEAFVKSNPEDIINDGEPVLQIDKNEEKITNLSLIDSKKKPETFEEGSRPLDPEALELRDIFDSLSVLVVDNTNNQSFGSLSEDPKQPKPIVTYPTIKPTILEQKPEEKKTPTPEIKKPEDTKAKPVQPTVKDENKGKNEKKSDKKKTTPDPIVNDDPEIPKISNESGKNTTPIIHNPDIKDSLDLNDPNDGNNPAAQTSINFLPNIFCGPKDLHTCLPNIGSAIEQVIGYYSFPNKYTKVASRLVSGKSLEQDFIGYHQKENSKMANWGADHTIFFIKKLAEKSQLIKNSELLVIGDLSKKGGGGLPGHKSHQNGLDFDIGFIPADGVQLEINNFPNDFLNPNRSMLTKKFDIQKNWQLARMAIESNWTYMIITHPVVKKAFCKMVKDSGKLNELTPILSQIIPDSTHYDHFHIRLKCPISSPRCTLGPIISMDNSGCNL